MSLSNLIASCESISVLFIAPPAWGKTHQLIELIKSQRSQRFVYLAPLRAIIEEVKLKMSGVEIKCSQDEKDWFRDKQIQVLITTPEKWFLSFENFADWNEQLVFILDEYHLFYEWRDFRPQLEECLGFVFSFAQKVLLLSATIDENIEKDFWLHSKKYFSHSYKIDLGNFTLKNSPQRFFPLNSLKDHFKALFIFVKAIMAKDEDCILVFFNYRWQVEWAQKASQRLGLKTLSCCGGQSQQFLADLQATPNPQVIWCTKVLSHGVNLPKIGLVVILSKDESMSTWIQMLGRGGRRGEVYHGIAYPPQLRALK